MEDKSVVVGMIAYDRMTNLDFVGPYDIISRVRASRTIVLGKSREPIVTDTNYRLLPEMTLDEAPDLDIIFVPGGPGSTALMEDEEVLCFLRERAPKAQWVTSVCTGALVLGAAGLLDGFRAATHWSCMDLLPLFGATPVNERVVIDGNRATGGGVTAGIDFGLTLIARIWGEEQAKLIQLGTEYNPAPPFNAGSPDTAPEVLPRFRELSKASSEVRRQTAERAAAKRQPAI